MGEVRILMIKYIGSRPSTWNCGHLNTRRGKNILGMIHPENSCHFDCTPQSWAGACYPSMVWGGFPLLTIIDSIDPVKWGRYHFSRKWVWVKNLQYQSWVLFASGFLIQGRYQFSRKLSLLGGNSPINHPEVTNPGLTLPKQGMMVYQTT